jgi:drug/metabolite transporter (DMT)-like permease
MSTHDHTAMPQGRDIALLSLGVMGIGMSGPVIALSKMAVPTLIMFRNLLGALTMLPFALRKKEWQTSGQRKAIGTAAISGVFLAVHFLCFFFAMRLTSVAAGTALTATQPIFTALVISFRGGHIPKRAWWGMGIAFASVLFITGIDLQISLRSFAGDIVALTGAALAAGYVLTGSHSQKVISTSTYTSTCYFICSVTVLPIALFFNPNIFTYPAREWWLLIALFLGAQMLGHTMFNLSLKRVSPAVVSLIVFFEVPVSAILAFWWMGQNPPAGTIPGIVGLLVGCGIFIFRSHD